MSEDSQKVPESIKRSLRAMLLDQLADSSTLDVYELELFNWYVQETEKPLEVMLSAERAFIQEQINAESDAVNDSGIVAVEYYLKRVRYSHVIYITSLLETFLERACNKLTMIVGAHNVPFSPAELKGDQWSVKRKFLEKYGGFHLPDDVWSKIKALITLRNILVHDNGSTSDLKPEKQTMLAKQVGINMNGHEVVVEAEYVYRALKAIRSLVQFIEARLAEVVERALQSSTVA